jgi:hypothetical protein
MRQIREVECMRQIQEEEYRRNEEEDIRGDKSLKLNGGDR